MNPVQVDSKPDEEVKEVIRKRKANFSPSEITVMTDLIEKNIDILQSKLTNNITNKRKNKIWQEITDSVNGLGVSIRTVQELKDKWKNLTSKAKKEYSSLKRERKITGGGPPPKQPSQATEKIIELFQDTPSFTGLSGFDAGYTEENAHISIDDGAEEQDGEQAELCLIQDKMLEAVLPDEKTSTTPVASKKITQADVLKEQYMCLKAKQVNQALKKKKLELEILYLEQKLKKED